MSEERAAVEINDVNKILGRIFNQLKKGHLSHERQHCSSIRQQPATDVLISTCCLGFITLGALNVFDAIALLWQITVAFLYFCGVRNET